MRIDVVSDLGASHADCLVVPLFTDLPDHAGLLAGSDAGALLAKARSDGRLKAKKNECLWLPIAGERWDSVLAVGLGDSGELDANTVRQALGHAAPVLRRHAIRSLLVDGSVEFAYDAAVEALILSSYRFKAYRTGDGESAGKPRLESVTIHAATNREDWAARCETARVLAESQNWARELGDVPPSDMPPTVLAERAREMTAKVEGSIETLGEAELTALGMGAILGVARGSDAEAQLIILHYTHPEAEETLAIVGKAVTYDAGGLTLKQLQHMVRMQYDMGGAAAALGAFRAVALLKPRVNLVCVAPASENMPDGRAYKPGDVLTAHNGVTIEIGSADAEGRLLLADALSYTEERFAPDAMVDIATLTGGCIQALGRSIAGVMSPDDALTAELIAAGEATHDRLWRLPVDAEFREHMKGRLADTRNRAPNDDGAGASYAAGFLSYFVKMRAWAHVDIAGKAIGMPGASYLDPQYGSGFGTRLLARWVLNRAARA